MKNFQIQCPRILLYYFLSCSNLFVKVLWTNECSFIKGLNPLCCIKIIFSIQFIFLFNLYNFFSRQNYYGGSHATNLNMGRYGRSVRSKRSPRFFQSFASGSNSTSIPIAKRLRRSPQFLQNYAPGSQSQNFNCQFGGCGNIGGPQQIHGGYVSNYGSGFG